MAEWKNKLRFWRNDAHLARSTGGTGSAGGHSVQQMPNPTDHVANGSADVPQTEDNNFGIKLLAPGEAPTIEWVYSRDATSRG
jgi:hypothetical protein